MSLTGAQFWTNQFMAPDTGSYAGVRVYHYAAGTSTDTDVWTDEAKATPAAQPVVGDGQGRVSFYGDNIYRLVVKTSVADGDIQLYDYDNVKIMQKDACLRAENRGTGYPSATSSNIGQIFGKVDSTGDITELGVNLDGTQFSPFQFQTGAITARTQTWAYGADLASATTLTLGSDGNVFNVTGNTSISGISATTAGTPIILRMQGQAQLSHNATSLILWNGVNFTPETGDVIFFESLGSGNYYEVARRSNSLLSDPTDVQNVAISAGVATNALTVSLKTAAGDDPSGSDLCRISFRNPTLTTGTYNRRTVSSAKSVVISNGSTLGAKASQYLRLWVVAIDAESASAGAGVELALWNAVNAVDTSVVSYTSVNEGAVYTTTAEGGAGAADSAATLYSTTARSSVPVRILGYVEVQIGTSGAWSNSPTVVQVLGPGVHQCGDVVQEQVSLDGAYAVGTTTMSKDDTIPQSSAGVQFMTRAITPLSRANILEIEHVGNYAQSTNVAMLCALFQDSTAGALAAWFGGIMGGAPQIHTSLAARHRMVAATTSSTTFKIRAGLESAGSTYFNGLSGARIFGSVAQSSLVVREIFV